MTREIPAGARQKTANTPSGTYFHAALGWCALIFTDKRPLRLFITPSRAAAKKAVSQYRQTPPSLAPRGLVEAIRRLCSGEPEKFDGYKRIGPGSAFQQKVWRATTRIPRGQTRAYGQLARALGNPKLARAVGAALAANPLPLLVPCHRVVASNGLGGFSGGLTLKIRLLQLEGHSIHKSARKRSCHPTILYAEK